MYTGIQKQRGANAVRGQAPSFELTD